MSHTGRRASLTDLTPHAGGQLACNLPSSPTAAYGLSRFAYLTPGSSGSSSGSGSRQQPDATASTHSAPLLLLSDQPQPPPRVLSGRRRNSLDRPLSVRFDGPHSSSSRSEGGAERDMPHDQPPSQQQQQAQQHVLSARLRSAPGHSPLAGMTHSAVMTSGGGAADPAQGRGLGSFSCTSIYASGSGSSIPNHLSGSGSSIPNHISGSEPGAGGIYRRSSSSELGRLRGSLNLDRAELSREDSLPECARPDARSEVRASLDILRAPLDPPSPVSPASSPGAAHGHGHPPALCFGSPPPASWLQPPASSATAARLQQQQVEELASEASLEFSRRSLDSSSTRLAAARRRCNAAAAATASGILLTTPGTTAATASGTTFTATQGSAAQQQGRSPFDQATTPATAATAPDHMAAVMPHDLARPAPTRRQQAALSAHHHTQQLGPHGPVLQPPSGSSAAGELGGGGAGYRPSTALDGVKVMRVGGQVGWS